MDEIVRYLLLDDYCMTYCTVQSELKPEFSIPIID